MLGKLMFLKLIFLDFIFQNCWFQFVRIWNFIVNCGFDVCVGFVMEIVEQMIDMLVGIGCELDFLVPEI